MTFQEFSDAVRRNTYNNIEIYEDSNIVVFEFNGVIITLFDNGTYDIDSRSK